MKFSRTVAIALCVGAIAISGCTNQAAEEAKAKEFWESSRVPPPGYVAKQQAAQAAAQAKMNTTVNATRK